MSDSPTLRRDARGIFDEALAAADAGRAVREAVRVEGTRLRICGAEFALHKRVYSVAVGKAAAAMAAALDEMLGERLTRGVVSAPAGGPALPGRWRVYAGGHPLPNGASLAAARDALELLREADCAGVNALVVFLVSGGGSAMLELPRDPRVSLEDLREANGVLVASGASITEVNAVRRSLSAVKGGGLAAAAGGAARVTLIVSDTNEGCERDVASGPTLSPDANAPDPREVVRRYGIAGRLPASVLRAMSEGGGRRDEDRVVATGGEHFVLLDNSSACDAAAAAARRLGYAADVARDLIEEQVAEGAAGLVVRLLNLYRREGGARGVCLISGGEFGCPVRGGGVGGRNAETALRCAFEFEKVSGGNAGFAGPRELLALCAGTDGVDGNSPAAGAVADGTTLARARASNLSPEKHLEESDAFTLFDALGDAVVTGPTGTNVRDLRVLLAGG